jgi:DNA-binding CsgD family transcriptional regulator
MTGSGLGVVDELVPTLFQLKILRQKASGKTDRAAAHALGVGERTIRRQIESLIGVLAVSNRAALFVEVGRRGWLDLIAGEDPVGDEVAAEEAVIAMRA